MWPFLSRKSRSRPFRVRSQRQVLRELSGCNFLPILMSLLHSVTLPDVLFGSLLKLGELGALSKRFLHWITTHRDMQLEVFGTCVFSCCQFWPEDFLPTQSISMLYCMRALTRSPVRKQGTYRRHQTTNQSDVSGAHDKPATIYLI